MDLTPLQRPWRRYLARALTPSATHLRSVDGKRLRRPYAIATAPPASSAAPSDPTLEIYDVVVLGGGPAGLSLLSALRSSPRTAHLRCALIEAQDLGKTANWSPPSATFSNRVSSLTPKSVAFLKKIGAWQHVQRKRVQAYGEMQVWDGVSGSRIEFDWPEEGRANSSSQQAGSTSSPPQPEDALERWLDEGDESPNQEPPHPGAQDNPHTVAYMTENANLTRALVSRLTSLGGVTIQSPVRLESITFGSSTDDIDLSQWPLLTLDSGERLLSRLLVGADGFNSPVRSFACIDSHGWDYEQHGVVATVRLEGQGWGGEDWKTAYQRFLPTGPIALLPLPGNLSTLVWSTTPSHAALLKSVPPEHFTALVNAGFRLSPADLAYLFNIMPSSQLLSADFADEVAWRLPHAPVQDPRKIPQSILSVQPDSVASFPLRLRHASHYTTSRIALVGDAAHTMHPLAGQGLNMGQGDVEALVKVIEAGVQVGADIGSSILLEDYEAARYAGNDRMLGVVDKLNKLYRTEFGPIVGLRSMGLDMVNRMGPVKRFFMSQAAGLS